MLRDYQAKGETDIYKAWETYQRVMYQLPTGGGKTVNVTNITRTELARGARVVFIAHREELISQAWNTFHKHQIFAGIIKADIQPNYSLPAQIASIQTLARRSKLPHADFVIIDEGHHGMDDNSYGKVIKQHWPNAKVLSVTATPYRLNGKGFRPFLEHLVTTVQLPDLIDDGYLVPVKYLVTHNPDLSKVRITNGDFNIEDAAQVMGAAPLVQSYLENCEGQSGIVFGVNVEHSQKIVSDYLKAGIKAAHIDANTDDVVRRRILNEFRDKKILILSNVGIATEGFDVPNMDFVQLAAPTKSLSKFLQEVGRATRVDNNLIKDVYSADERKLLIASSSKPHCTILDNAGLFKDHGLPTDAHDWQYHFNGYKRKKKNELPLEEIEIIIEYIAEDESGRRVRTSTPDEIEGLKLIEITKTAKQKNIDLSSLRELDEGIRLGENLYNKAKREGTKGVNKIGHFAYSAYMKYCRSKNLLVADEIWEILLRRLYHEPEDKKITELKNFNDIIDAVREQFEQQIGDKLEGWAKDAIDKRIDDIKKYQVPKSFLMEQRKEYFNRLASQSPTTNDNTSESISTERTQEDAESSTPPLKRLVRDSPVS